MNFREEKKIYYGAQTQKSIENFPISGERPDLNFIYSIVLIKKAAAIVNGNLGLLEKKYSKAIISACESILNGKYNDQFVVDIFHSGAGTSLHMNVNEVIAKISNTHPNDHVNMSQSTNDVIPSALRIATISLLPKLCSSIEQAADTFKKKGKEFKTTVKSGRTHLQDAMPVLLGEEFKAYGKTLENDLIRIKEAAENIKLLGIGGTAVGTGVNSHPQYRKLIIKELRKLTGIKLEASLNLQESMQNTSDFLGMSSSLQILSQNLIRIGNDLRLLSSGPGAGFSEISLPEVTQGSSIMPGKVNPSIVEMLTMVCFQVIGFSQSILLGCMNGQLELNVFMPLIASNLIKQIKYLTNSLIIFNDKCLLEIKENKTMIDFWLYRSMGTAAILNPYIGYEKAASLLKESIKTGKTIAELAVEKKYLTKQKAKKIFNFKKMIKPNL